MFNPDTVAHCQPRPRVVLLLTGCLAFAGFLQAEERPEEAGLRKAFLGKQVMLKIDMPGTQLGVDLRLDRPEPMDWRQYSQRLKQYGVSLGKGEFVTVTTIVVKKDMMEFQLNGGGFGTMRDNSATSESSYTVSKTSTEIRLEKELKKETDPEKRKQLQKELDRERSAREREQQRQNADAEARTEAKRQVLRIEGGARFNLRWNAPIETVGLTPEVVMRQLGPYIDFQATPGAQSEHEVSPRQQGTGEVFPLPDDDIPLLQKGTSYEKLRQMFGEGRVVKETISTSGGKTQQVEFLTEWQKITVTLVNDGLTRYKTSSK